MEEKFTKKYFNQLKNRKSIKGHSESDVANSSIRKILSQLSKKFPAVDEDYFKNCLEFFDYKCPYTDEKLSIKNNELDHIIPQNRKYCGLNVKGNIIICSPDANRKKGTLTASDFLLGKTKKSEQFWKEKGSTLKEREERLEKLKEFQKNIIIIMMKLETNYLTCQIQNIKKYKMSSDKKLMKRLMNITIK